MTGSALDSVTFSLRQPDTDAAGEPLTLHVERGDRLPPPSSSEQSQVVFAGVEGRWTPSRAELEWVDRVCITRCRASSACGADRHRERARQDRGRRGRRMRRRRLVRHRSDRVASVGAIVTLGIQARRPSGFAARRAHVVHHATVRAGDVPRLGATRPAGRLRRAGPSASPRSSASRSWRRTTCGSPARGPPAASSSTIPNGRSGSRWTWPRSTPPRSLPSSPRRPHRTGCGGERRGDPRFDLRLGASASAPAPSSSSATGARIRIAAVLPDELVERPAPRLGAHPQADRRGARPYLLVQPREAPSMSSGRSGELSDPSSPSTWGSSDGCRSARPVRPYFRAGDAVLPPVLLKALFGEFAARPTKGSPGRSRSTR